MQPTTVIIFPPFRLDRANERLWCGEQPIHLRPKTVAVLQCLLEHAGQLVTKADLLDTVWPETVVSEAVLLGCIGDLRRALNDDPKQPQFIETVHRRGYRFIAPLRPPVSPDESAVMRVRRYTPTPRFRRPQHFVGRDAELAQLMQWWTTAQQGTRQVGIIAGEPGIGKTALVEAFVSQVATMADVWVGHGQCIEPYGPGEPYLPVLEALGRLCREPDGASLVSVLRQYAPSWLVQMPALVPPAEREALQRAVGPLAQMRMLRELTEALDALTAERPLVLVLEDLHWSDGATLEWLAYVARRRDPARLLLLGTYRPADAMVQAHPLRAVLTELQQHGQCVELALDYLSEDDVTAYLRQRFGSTRLAVDPVRVLYQRTHGNPLFLTAVVDEIVRQQVVREEANGWDMRGGVETIPTLVPTTLRALIEHQLAHCSPETQTLLAAASVAGVEFTTAEVAAGLERADDEIEAQCATLAHQGQFLQTRGSTEWPDGTVTACFGFRHALYQDVVYQRIPAGRQTRWHARIGSRLAQGFGEHAGDLAAVLAMHFVRGHRLLEAVPYLRQAGETAMVRSAHREAVGYFEQALAAWRHLPENRDTTEQGIDLLCNLRQALVPLQAFEQGFAHLRAAETLAERLDDRHRLGRICALMTHYFWFVGAYERAIACGQRALALTANRASGPLQAAVNSHLGQIYYALGDYHRALGVLRQNETFFAGDRLYEHTGEIVLGAVGTHAWIAHCLGELGAFAEGRRHAHEAVRIAEAAEHLSSTIYAHYCLGRLALRQGELPQAILVLEGALARCRAANIPLWHRLLAATLGVAYALCGRVADTVLLLEEAVTMPEGGSISTGIYMYVSLSEAALLTDRLDEAHRHATRALALAREGTERGDLAWTRRLLGDIAMHRDPPETDQAEADYRRALALADELGMHPLAAHCHCGLGMLYHKMQRQGQARTALSTATALYRAMEMTFWLAQAEAALVEVGSPAKTERLPHNASYRDVRTS